MANADKGNIEVISGSIGDLIFRIEMLTSDRDTIKLCVRAAVEYEWMRSQLTQRAADVAYCECIEPCSRATVIDGICSFCKSPRR